MIKDRIALLEQELNKAKEVAAKLYFQIAIEEDTEKQIEYDKTKEQIASLQIDLQLAKSWLETPIASQ